jgi:hypothetical protein
VTLSRFGGARMPADTDTLTLYRDQLRTSKSLPVVGI